MRERWMTVTFVLALLMVTAVGCSLVEGTGDDPSGEPGDGASKGTLIITVETEPADQAGTFQFTGVPSGTVSIDNALVVADLEPGTYTTTEVDPAPDFDVTAVRCDDGDSDTPSRGDPQTRTAVMNLDPGETVECSFTNTQRGAAVVASQTTPEGMEGTFQFTGVPTGTIPADGTLVAANLPPGTYTATERDPAPQFDLVEISCDDGASATASGGDPVTRSAIFNIDPGEIVTCVFRNARRGTIVVRAEVASGGTEGSFQYTGVPTGTISTGGTLVVANIEPGTYTTTEVDPAPDFELTEVECDDSASATASSGDPVTRSAIFNVDPGETVTCTFIHETDDSPTGGGNGASTGGGVNPFEQPDRYLADFPLPDPLPPDAGSAAVPKAGPWVATNFEGELDCGITSQTIPASPSETGTLEVLDGGQTVIGTSLQEDQAAPITMSADPAINGRYAGSVDGVQEEAPVTIDYYWQVVTEEYIVGYLISSFTSEGVTCAVYRPYELRYNG